MQVRFSGLVIGDSRTIAIDRLGPPMSSGSGFARQLETYTEELANSQKSGSVEYLVWRNGVNWYYCIGFDADGRIIFKAEGHS